MSMFANKTVILVLPNGTEIKVEKALNYASGYLKDFLNTTDQNKEIERIPFNDTPNYRANICDFNLLNKFIKYVDENLHDELREHAEDHSYWIQKLDSKKADLLKLADGFNDEVIVRCVNLGDFLIAHPFTAFGSLVLYERLHKMKLKELRERLGETNDFDEARMNKIADFKDL